MHRKKDIWVILIALAIVAVLLAVQKLQGTRDISDIIPQETALPQQTQPAADHPQEEIDGAQDAASAKDAQPEAFGPALPQAASEPVAGYVLVGVKGKPYGDPIPMDRDKIIAIKQDNDHINKIHITPTSVEMLSSTCENQDCVNEGVVTTENYQTRVLGAYILCLPNEVTVEFVPAAGSGEE